MARKLYTVEIVQYQSIEVIAKSEADAREAALYTLTSSRDVTREEVQSVTYRLDVDEVTTSQEPQESATVEDA